MQQMTLTQLVQVPQDLDYVHHFQELARVNLALHQRGPDTRLLVQKAMLELDVGNFEGARQAAREALALAPDDAEAQYQRGLACVLMAFVKAEAVPTGPGHRTSPIESVRSLLEEAGRAFAGTVQANPDDVDAQEDMDAVTRTLEDHAEDASLEAALRGEPEATPN
jgi:tetratricopeptide (TPR) repeat protein